MSTLSLVQHTCTAQYELQTPLGSMLLARSALGLCGLWFEGQQHHPGTLQAPLQPNDVLLAQAAQQLEYYFAGQLVHFDLPLDPQGTAFQRRVWQALLGIPLGATSSYSDIALRAASPQAVRAVGAAIGKNPLSIVIPCHRVVGRDGSLTGYAGGLPRKQALLELEARLRVVPQA